MQFSSENKVDRQKIFSEPTTRELLRRLVVEKRTLTPDVGDDGRVHYRIADEVLGKAHATAAWIDEMLELGILNKSAVKDMVMCPTHLRVDPMIQLECTKCKARRMRKTTLVQHLYCGYIEADTKFNKEGYLVCPNCKRPIHKADELSSSGVWYECQSCLSKTSSPRFVFICREGHEFTTSDLSLAPVCTYGVEESVVAQLKNTLVLAPALAVLFASLGYVVTSPARIQGLSGATHVLDVYARNGEMDVALQIAVDSKQVESSAVMSLFAKSYDLKPKLSILIAIPSASGAAKQINSGYGITLVEDSDGGGAVQKVKELLLLALPFSAERKE